MTEEGREVSKNWLREMLSVRSQEYPDFPVAVSFLTLLVPEDVQRQFEKKEIVPRLFMLEVEHSRAVLWAELEWLRDIIEDFRTASSRYKHTNLCGSI
ncbi:hypothetical protein ACFQZT_26910 [Paenibacillus sp. GCM10027628]|uniref:hypothetical protein n=1 Tax=Paenibacillus sp. GCM10027628 TaxID=3273413 RepID=UPI003636ADA1